jgi:hypothetical protein
LEPLEAAGSEARNKKKFLLKKEVVETWSMVAGVIKRSKTVSSFKNAYRRHREDMVENA